MGSTHDITGTTASGGQRSRRRRLRTGVLAAVAVIALSACGSDFGSNDSAADEATESGLGIAGGEDAMEEAPAEMAPPETGGAAAAGLPVDLSDRDIITSVGLTMSTSDVRSTTDDIRRITATAGAIVFSSDVFIDDTADDGSVPGGGQIVIKVAPENLDRLVTDLDGAGVVTRVSQDADDVTDQLIDLDIRIRQAEAGIARLEVLLEDAADLEDVFAIEFELTDRQVELEQLRAAERNTENLVALATLTIQVEYRTPTALEEITESDDGIGDAFADGWNAFVGALFALGYVLAITAPFLVTLLFVTVVAWLLGRRWTRRQADARERERNEADLRGDHLRGPAPGSTTPPPPVAAERISDDPSSRRTASATHESGDTVVDTTSGDD